MAPDSAIMSIEEEARIMFPLREICVMEMKTEEIRETFANAETVVYWDVEDFPVPDIVSFNQNIRLALANAGYHGNVSITAYGDHKKPEDEEYYKNAGINFVPRGSKRGRMHKMLVDMHFLAAKNNPTCAPTNLMVIAKSITAADDVDDIGVEGYLAEFNTQCYNVLLAVHNDGQLKELPFMCNYTIWRWSNLFAGGNPLHHSLVYRQPPPRDNGCPKCGK